MKKSQVVALVALNMAFAYSMCGGFHGATFYWWDTAIIASLSLVYVLTIFRKD